MSGSEFTAARQAPNPGGDDAVQTSTAEPRAGDLTVLVNTSDGFDDCWEPFFQLFARYWPACPYPVVLNTEVKAPMFTGVDVRPACVARGGSKRLTWSECLARCLLSIETPFVLYLQEDFFLDAPVRQGYIEAFLDEMRAGRADVIRLKECEGAGPWSPSAHPLLWAVDQHARYRVALQAALWRKSVLRSQLRLHEDPWQFEIFGSARAARRRDVVLCANRDRFHGEGKEIVPYEATGVVRGKWQRHIVEPLFAKHDIPVDFERRGFHDPASPAVASRSLLARLTDRVRSPI